MLILILLLIQIQIQIQIQILILILILYYTMLYYTIRVQLPTSLNWKPLQAQLAEITELRAQLAQLPYVEVLAASIGGCSKLLEGSLLI